MPQSSTQQHSASHWQLCGHACPSDSQASQHHQMQKSDHQKGEQMYELPEKLMQDSVLFSGSGWLKCLYLLELLKLDAVANCQHLEALPTTQNKDIELT
jgi:hypothetical protein